MDDILIVFFVFEIWHWRELFFRKIPSPPAFEGKGIYSFFRKVSKISIGPSIKLVIIPNIRELSGTLQGCLSFSRKKQ